MNISCSATINVNGLSVTLDVQTSVEALRCLLGDGIFSRGELEFQDLFQHSVHPAVFPLLQKASEILSGALIIESCNRLKQELAETVGSSHQNRRGKRPRSKQHDPDQDQ